MIDLTKLYTHSVSLIDISGVYDIPCKYFSNSDVIDLSQIEVKNGVVKYVDDELYLIMKINGKMKINDSVTLKEVWYPFNIDLEEKLDEFIEKDEKSLDIIEVLWQNIVLEVPLRYTLVDDYSNYLGDGWKLVSEEELVNNNPFNTLLKDEDRSD